MNIFTENVAVDLVGILVAVAVGFVTFFKWRFGFWKRKGLPSLGPVIFYGDTKGLMTGKFSFGEQFQVFYNTFKAKGLKHGGAFVGPKPFYIPTDPELVKHIMQTDFPHFVNHGFFIDEKHDPLSGHLFNLEDAKWKNMRTKLTPTFTSGKMKMMFQTLADCTVGLKEVMDQSANNKTSVDIKDILGRFTTDIIGSCAFGIECNSLKDPEAEFRKYGKKVFESNIRDKFKRLLTLTLPHNVLKSFGFKLVKTDVEKFFMKAVKDTVDYREKNHVYRKDFMHLLLQLKNRGTVTDDEKITDEAGKFSEKALSMNELSAQAFVFFLAGFETSSTTMTFALLELATNPEIQEKLRSEINKVLEKHGELTYDAVMDMHYMDKVVNESLRKFPPVPVLPRVCTKNYTIPGTDVVLEKGINVAISTLGIHRDPEFYPDPDKFDPERFSEEGKKSRPAFTWIPFGEGPRICIGLRFGLMQSKVGLATLLKNYKISLSKKTHLPIAYDRNGLIMAVEGGVWIDVEKIN